MIGGEIVVDLSRVPFIDGLGEEWSSRGLVFGSSLEMLGYPRGDGCVWGCSTKRRKGESKSRQGETGQKPYWAVVQGGRGEGEQRRVEREREQVPSLVGHSWHPIFVTAAISQTYIYGTESDNQLGEQPEKTFFL